MSTLREQFSAVRKAQVETQLDFVRSFTNSMVESTRQVVALNLSTGRNSIARSTDALRQLLTVQSPSDLVNLSTQQAGLDTLLNYSHQLFNIASGAQAELLRAAAPAALVPGLKALPSAKVDVEVQADVPAARELAASVDAAPEPIQAPVDAPVEAPAAQVASAPEAEPAIEIAELVPVPVPGQGIEETVLAKAIGDTIEQTEALVLSASPLATAESADLKITGIAPVDAAAPLAQNKPSENGSSKPRRKK